MDEAKWLFIGDAKRESTIMEEQPFLAETISKWGKLVRRALRRGGFDMVRYTPEQLSEIQQVPASHYRDFVSEEALTIPVGETSLVEARFLGQLIGESDQARPIVEIGTLFGTSTRAMALQKPVEQELITVDNYKWNPLRLPPHIHERITATVLAEAVEKLNLRIVNMDKAEFYSTWNSVSPSIVYFDAIHTYEETRLDILWAKEVGADIICGHDYDEETMPGVVKAVAEFGGAARREGSLWVL